MVGGSKRCEAYRFKRRMLATPDQLQDPLGFVRLGSLRIELEGFIQVLSSLSIPGGFLVAKTEMIVDGGVIGLRLERLFEEIYG